MTVDDDLVALLLAARAIHAQAFVRIDGLPDREDICVVTVGVASVTLIQTDPRELHEALRLALEKLRGISTSVMRAASKPGV